jgi:hypothetical protein
MYFAAAQKELQLGSVKASSELVVSLLLLRWLNWLQIQLTNSVSTSKDTFLLKKPGTSLLLCLLITSGR